MRKKLIYMFILSLLIIISNKCIIIFAEEMEDIYLLDDIIISDGYLDNEFSKDINNYKLYIDNTTESITITPISVNDLAVIKVNNQLIESGQSMEITYDENNKINIEVISPNNESSSLYQIDIILPNNNLVNTNNTNLSDDATLKGITISEGELDPLFNSQSEDYTVTVEKTVESITITPILNDEKGNFIIKKDEQEYIDEIPLVVGENLIVITTLAEDGETSKLYNLTMTRQKSDIATLEDIKINGKSITGFENNQFNYDVIVKNSVDKVEIEGITTDPLASTDITNPYNLNIGKNNITITVTAENNTDYKIYSIDITREEDPTLSINEGVSRIAGTTRYDTATFISQSGWNGESEAVILSSGEKFPDALSGSPLAYQLNAPILLCQQNSIPSDTLAEIQRLNPKNVYILGGPATINESIKEKLETKGYTVTRISNDTRFTTAIAIGEELRKYNEKSTAVITCAYKYPDALSFGPIAAKNNWPILFTDIDKLTGITKEALQNWGISNVKIIGGPASVSEAVKKELEQMGIIVERIWGQDRENVALESANQYYPNTEGIIITTGYKFTDALTGGSLAGKLGYPIILVKEGSIKDEALSYIKNSGASKILILGGEMSVDANVRNRIYGLLNNNGITIMLDPGHGGNDPGTTAGYRYINKYEKTLNSELAIKILEKLTIEGYNVIYTRNPYKDDSVNIRDRDEIANNANPDLFISIHHDGSINTNEKGFSVHWSSFRPNIEEKDLWVSYRGGRYEYISQSIRIENGVEETYINFFYRGVEKSLNIDEVIVYDEKPSPEAIKSKEIAINLYNKLSQLNFVAPAYKCKDHNLYVTRNTNVPSVLFEAGYLSNKDEANELNNSNNQEQMAKKVVEAINEYFCN